MAGQIFGGGMDDDVGALVERLLQIRGDECVVDDGDRAMTVGDSGNGRHVVDLQKRVGEHFEVHGLGRTSMRIALGGFAGHRRIERLVIGGVHFLYDDAPAFEILVEQRVGAAVDVLADDDTVAGLEDRQHRVDGGQAGTERETARAMLKLRDLLLQELAGRVAAARVIPAGHGLDRFESIGGRVVDRRVHGSGVVVVDRQSVDELSVESGHGAHPLGVVSLPRAVHAITGSYLTVSWKAPRAGDYRRCLYNVRIAIAFIYEGLSDGTKPPETYTRVDCKRFRRM